MRAEFKKYTLKFKQPGGTSRGVLTEKTSYFILIKEREVTGIGECGILKGLSADDVPEYEEALKWTCINIHIGLVALREELKRFPSIYFGVEQALADFKGHGKKMFYDEDFYHGHQGIPINGLIWMGEEAFMRKQIQSKLKQGFHCLKMKIGAIEWETELAILRSIRKKYNKDEVELRVDANGAFNVDQAKSVLEELADLEVHSIEQPIKKGQWQEMAALCESTPTPIALDEELIGVFEEGKQRELMQTIKPQYIILKPSFIGGWYGSDQWLAHAEALNAGWWITSALESNIGLNAIAQYTASKLNAMPQGLGTGGLYTNNIDSPLEIIKGKLWYNKSKTWEEIE
jgi:o-succinylbenzoate synthase